MSKYKPQPRSSSPAELRRDSCLKYAYAYAKAGELNTAKWWFNQAKNNYPILDRQVRYLREVLQASWGKTASEMVKRMAVTQ
jgi:hypothetical protein